MAPQTNPDWTTSTAKNSGKLVPPTYYEAMHTFAEGYKLFPRILPCDGAMILGDPLRLLCFAVGKLADTTWQVDVLSYGLACHEQHRRF